MTRAACTARLALSCAGALLLAAGATTVSVLRIPVPFEFEQTVSIDNTVEYIFEFTPTSEQGQWPARIRLAASGGDTARPVLLTARQTTGAQTWQLPYEIEESDQPLFELQRTLCFRISEDGGSATERFSLHVSSASNASVVVSARVDPARDWRLSFGLSTHLHVTQMSPRVYYYNYLPEQEHVRLVVSSEDDICAIVGVQNYTCPVAETRETVTRAGGGVFMTVQRSGGAHLSRSQFPNGFYVVALVLASDVPCVGEEDPELDWLYEAAAVGRDPPTTTPAPSERTKSLTFELRAALTRAQYAVACVVTLLVFLGFYAAFLGLVFAQRFKTVKRFIGPKAVLAETNGGNTNEEGLSPSRRGRHGSNATLDSVDDDSESDEEPAPAGDVMPKSGAVNIAYNAENSPAASTVPSNGTVPSLPAAPPSRDAPVNETVEGRDTSQQQPANGNTDQVAAGGVGPFGLPARLTVAALARRRERTLRARSNRYLHTLYTVSVFYALPVLQFVAAFQIFLNVSGSLDLCYYNFLCAHPVGQLSDFNHVFSNLGYLLLGALFMLQVRRRRRRRKRTPRHQEYGIPAHYGLLSSLGAGMMVVALLSASYHVCPNQLNFQFDTAFMYVLAVLSMVKLYQARHPDINARAHATFGVLAVLIAIVVWGVLGDGALFWGMFTVLHVFTFLLLSLRIYYVGQFRLDPAGLAVAARGLRALPAARPLYASRLLALWLANAVNWGFAIYGLFSMSADFASHLLFILLGNTLLYMVFYLAMKLAHGERLRWYAWLYLAGAALAWAPAMYFFVSGSSSWSATPAQSRHLNHECRALRFYDSHDLWHMLSAVALYLTFNTMLTWDDGLSAVKRTDIAVF